MKLDECTDEELEREADELRQACARRKLERAQEQLPWFERELSSDELFNRYCFRNSANAT